MDPMDIGSAAQRPFSRRDFLKFAGITTGAAVAVQTTGMVAAIAAPPRAKYDTPRINCAYSTQVSIDVAVCAGASGAPAGFSLQWMTKDEYAANGDVWYLSDDPRLCKASFSGNANLSRYNLGPNECVVVRVGDFLFDNGASTNCGDGLTCETVYVFRVFAHADNRRMRSDFTANLCCGTLPCTTPGGDGCTYTQGYWKTHGPVGCVTGNNTNVWPVASLTLGSVVYTDLELCAILNKPAAGNGLIVLSHQLIAAKLNIANGATPGAIAGDVAAADALIGGLVVPPVGTGTLANSATSALTTALANYNEGAAGPGHCG